MKGLQSRHRKALQDGTGIPEVSPAPFPRACPHTWGAWAWGQPSCMAAFEVMWKGSCPEKMAVKLRGPSQSECGCARET